MSNFLLTEREALMRILPRQMDISNFRVLAPDASYLAVSEETLSDRVTD